MSLQRFVRVSVVFFVLLASLHAQQSEAWKHLNFNVGGGAGTPMNPTGGYAGIGPNFVIGAGYTFNEHHAIVGQYMWNDLPPTTRALTPLNTVSAGIGLYATTANYRYQVSVKHAGIYFIGGTGWYYRHATIKRYTIPVATPCQPIYSWWGFNCANGLVPTSQTRAYRGLSSIGGNGGLGMTFNLASSGFKVYMEARYHYAPTPGVHTAVIPVTFGLSW